MSKTQIQMKSNATEKEVSNRGKLLTLLKTAPIPDSELLSNLGLFLYRQNLSSMLFMIELYRKSLDVHGVIVEFGVRWGRNLALFEALRGTFEPFNHNRKIIGFDSFEGFPSVHEKDGADDIIAAGSFNVTDGYEQYLAQVLDCQEKENPIPNIKRTELRKGDATKEVRKYLDENPQTIISLAYFDFDIYEPTKKCLEAIRPHLTRGSVIGFDELNCENYPGETIALRETLGLDQYRIQKTIFSPTQSYLVIE